MLAVERNTITTHHPSHQTKHNTMRAFRMDNSCHGLITGRRVMIPLVLIFAISFVFYENTIVLNQFVGSNWQDSQTLTIFQMATNVSVDSSGRARGAATLPGSSSIGNSHNNNNNNNNNNDTDHRELNRIHNKLDNITQLLEEVIQERARQHLLKDEQSQTPQVPEHTALTSQGDSKSAKNNSSSGAFSLSFDEVWQRKNEKNATTTMIRTGIIDDNSTTIDNGTIGIPESQWLLSQVDTELESWEARFTKDKTIPKIIHKVLLTKHGNIHDLLRNEPDELKQAHESWTKMNPGYQIRYFSLNLARAYLREYFHPVFLRAFDCIQAFAGKSNLFRLAVVFREGGWYSDWKEQCNIPELLEWLATQNQGRKRFNATIVFAYDKGTLHSSELEYIMNAFFGAQPRHPGK